MKKPSETESIVKPCLQYLAMKGILAWRNNTGAFAGEYKGKKRFVKFGVKGGSDILGIMPGGRALAVECKMPGEKVTADQEAFLATARNAGAFVAVVHSVDELIIALDAA